MARTPTAELESRIIDGARAVLVEVGPGGVTQRAVAKQAGVSPQSIYNRFDSKQALLDEVANEGFLSLTDELNNAAGVPLASFGDPIENIVEGMRRYRLFAVANPEIYGLMFDAPVPDFRISDRTLGTAFNSLSVLINAAQTAIDAGAFPDGDALDYAQQIWAAAHGTLRFELTNIGFIDDWTRHYDDVIATMLRGLATSAA